MADKMHKKAEEQALVEEAPKKEAPKAKLPAGLTQEMVDSFKAAYPKVGLARVAGVYVVTRPVTREEFVTLAATTTASASVRAATPTTRSTSPSTSRSRRARPSPASRSRSMATARWAGAR